jgi:hypothetical protein
MEWFSPGRAVDGSSLFSPSAVALTVCLHFRSGHLVE